MPALAAAPTNAGTASPSKTRILLELVGRWTNRSVLAAAVIQFYSAGLAIFGVSSFAPHAAGGWLAQLASLLTMIVLLAARIPFGISRLALLMFVLAILQPVLAFAFRSSLPAVSALHPVNGLAILALSIMLEQRLQRR